MKKNLIASLLVAFTLFSCNDKEAKQTEAATQKKEVSKDFVITLDVNVKKDDSFHIFYSEDGTTNFTEENSVWAEFKATPDANQQIVFRLPEGVFPTHLRMDFGVNKDQEAIQFNNMKMEYAGKTFDIKGAELHNYFQPNPETTNVDKSKNLIVPINKGKDKYFGPSFYPLPTLTERITALAK